MSWLYGLLDLGRLISKTHRLSMMNNLSQAVGLFVSVIRLQHSGSTIWR